MLADLLTHLALLHVLQKIGTANLFENEIVLVYVLVGLFEFDNMGVREM